MHTLGNVEGQSRGIYESIYDPIRESYSNHSVFDNILYGEVSGFIMHMKLKYLVKKIDCDQNLTEKDINYILNDVIRPCMITLAKRVDEPIHSDSTLSADINCVYKIIEKRYHEVKQEKQEQEQQQGFRGIKMLGLFYLYSFIFVFGLALIYKFLLSKN
jgi:hypothetical protein